MVRLPVSGLNVQLRLPTGADDVLLHEAAVGDTHLALLLLDRVAAPAAESGVAWSDLTVTDLETLLLMLRRLVFGDLIRSEGVCPAAGCGARMDISFCIGDYVGHHQPRLPHNIEAADEPGWYHLKSTPVCFRLPSGADQAAGAFQPRVEQWLAQRCIRPADVPAGLRRRAETAMEALAPSLSHEVQARCPECGAPA